LREVHNDEFNIVCYSSNIIIAIKSRTIRAGHVACIEEMRNAYRILVGELEMKTPFRRPKQRKQDHMQWILEK
jgi:hypothetical protein